MFNVYSSLIKILRLKRNKSGAKIFYFLGLSQTDEKTGVKSLKVKKTVK